LVTASISPDLFTAPPPGNAISNNQRRFSRQKQAFA
jgi:hypothetical protein